MKKRVVITGMGWVTALGQGVGHVWPKLLAGESGIGEARDLPEGNFRSRIAGHVDNFNAEGILHPKEQRSLDLFNQYGIVAAEEAIQQSGLSDSQVDKSRIGVCVSSGIGGVSSIENAYQTFVDRDADRLSPFLIPNICINILSGHISIRHQFTGPNLSCVTACATALHSMGVGARLIAYGDADAMIVGGSEKASTVLGMGGFAAMKALSTRNDAPQEASRPWDVDRDGFVVGDGAGVLVIESLDHALARGATPLAEIVGFGMSGDASHIVAPNGIGAEAAMRAAMNDAGCQPEDIGYVNAHGTSTPLGDLVELNAIKTRLGAHATSDKLAVSSTKGHLGHSLGATAAVESIVCVKALQDQVVPPTVNLHQPSEGCEDVNLVPLKSQNHAVEYAINNSFGFGGTNAVMVFKRYE